MNLCLETRNKTQGKIGSGQRDHFHEADNPRTGAPKVHAYRDRARLSLRVYLYVAYTYTLTRTYAHSAGRLHVYTDVLGTEIWRDPLDSTRLAIIQFIGLSKAPVHAVFPDRSLSLPLFLCLSFAPFRPFFLSLSFSRRAYALSLFFPLSRIYLLSVPHPFPPPSLSSRYNCLLSLVLSNRPSFPTFRLRLAHAATPRSRPPRRLPSGWRTIRSNTLR